MNPTPSPAAGSEELTEDKFYGQLDNIIMWCFELGFSAARREYGEQYKSAREAEPNYEDNLDSLIQDIMTSHEELLAAQNNATYGAVMEAIGEDEIENPMGLPEGENEGYDIKCYMRVSRNKLRAKLRQSIAKIFGINDTKTTADKINRYADHIISNDWQKIESVYIWFEFMGKLGRGIPGYVYKLPDGTFMAPYRGDLIPVIQDTKDEFRQVAKIFRKEPTNE